MFGFQPILQLFHLLPLALLRAELSNEVPCLEMGLDVLLDLIRVLLPLCVCHPLGVVLLLQVFGGLAVLFICVRNMPDRPLELLVFLAVGQFLVQGIVQHILGHLLQSLLHLLSGRHILARILLLHFLLRLLLLSYHVPADRRLHALDRARVLLQLRQLEAKSLDIHVRRLPSCRAIAAHAVGGRLQQHGGLHLRRGDFRTSNWHRRRPRGHLRRGRLRLHGRLLRRSSGPPGR
mmetsp:Transcript_37385/g.69776  ORF Transcript_37385/g.69776 Transcript_37385/m.69776 type:complete len:234 (-) Transcript_37385:552-1253(-)